MIQPLLIYPSDRFFVLFDYTLLCQKSGTDPVLVIQLIVSPIDVRLQVRSSCKGSLLLETDGETYADQSQKSIRRR